MKILELKLLVNGYKENREAAYETLLTGERFAIPYPMCSSDAPYISVLKVKIDDNVYVKQIVHPSDLMILWSNDIESLRHLIYFELMDEAFAIERKDFNEQATKILGDTIERI